MSLKQECIDIIKLIIDPLMKQEYDYDLEIDSYRDMCGLKGEDVTYGGCEYCEHDGNCPHKQMVKVNVSLWDYTDCSRNYIFSKPPENPCKGICYINSRKKLMQEMSLLKKELEEYKDWCAEFGEKYSDYMKYAKEFADQLKDDYVFFLINTDILPIVFYADYKKDHDYKSKTYTAGEFVKCGNQSIINIYCSMDNDVEVKQRIRHEVLHYCLGMNEMNSSDDSAIFHYLCGVYDAGAYKEMPDEEQKLYEKLLRSISVCERLHEKGMITRECIKNNVIAMAYMCGTVNGNVVHKKLFENGVELLEMLSKVDVEQAQQE